MSKQTRAVVGLVFKSSQKIVHEEEGILKEKVEIFALIFEKKVEKKNEVLVLYLAFKKYDCFAVYWSEN